MKQSRLVEQLRRIRPDDAYRREAVRQAKSSTKSVAAVAEELGIGNSTLYRWIAKYSDSKIERTETLEADHRRITSEAPSINGLREVREDPDEVLRLRKEVQFLRDENDILRRAALAFARTSYPTP